MRPQFFKPPLTPEEEQAYQAQAERQTEQIRGNIAAWQRWLKMCETHNADLPVILPSHITPLLGLESQETTKHKAISQEQEKARLSKIPTQPLKEPDTSRQDTQRLPRVESQAANTYDSIRREIWALCDTDEMRAIAPKHTTLPGGTDTSASLRKRRA